MPPLRSCQPLAEDGHIATLALGEDELHATSSEVRCDARTEAAPSPCDEDDLTSQCPSVYGAGHLLKARRVPPPDRKAAQEERHGAIACGIRLEE